MTSYWETQAQKYLYWQKPWTTSCQGDFTNLPIRWFVNGQTNACYNCIDRHLDQYGNKTALIFQANEIDDEKSFSYQDLYHAICHMCHLLKQLGVQKSDVVCIYLPMIPELLVTMLACARMGAIHNVIFAGFSADAIASRINDSQAKYVVTISQARRGKKLIGLKEHMDAALVNCPSVEKVLSLDDIQDIFQHQDHYPVTWLDSNHPLFILYTSGSTGQPKGILHSTAPYLVYVASTYDYIFKPGPDDIHWCTADCGWITGHSYLVYAPLLLAGTTLMYEGIPSYPDYGRFWHIIDKFKVNQFYTAPTAIRALRQQGDHWIKAYSLKSLKVLGTVGEPINPEVWSWYHEVVGQRRCPIVNTWWQTETGGALIASTVHDTEFVPGAVGKPLPGIEACIDKNAMLYIKKAWPGLMLDIFNHTERYKQGYLAHPELGYQAGDSCYIDDQGFYHITGRLDDVIKVSGHRLGSEELESALVSHPAISEAAVIGIPHDIKGECIIAYLIAFPHILINPDLEQSIITHIRQHLAPMAVPEKIIWVQDLPKTRSGKIMRRLLKKIACHQTDDLGDLSTLVDMNVLTDIIQASAEKKP